MSRPVVEGCSASGSLLSFSVGACCCHIAITRLPVALWFWTNPAFFVSCRFAFLLSLCLRLTLGPLPLLARLIPRVSVLIIVTLVFILLVLALRLVEPPAVMVLFMLFLAGVP